MLIHPVWIKRRLDLVEPKWSICLSSIGKVLQLNIEKTVHWTRGHLHTRSRLYLVHPVVSLYGVVMVVTKSRISNEVITFHHIHGIKIIKAFFLQCYPILRLWSVHVSLLKLLTLRRSSRNYCMIWIFKLNSLGAQVIIGFHKLFSVEFARKWGIRR